MSNVNIFCSNEAGELSVFCSKPLYLVGLCFSFNGSSDVTRGKERGSVTDSAVVLSIAVIWRESSGSLRGFLESHFTFCLSVSVAFSF